MIEELSTWVLGLIGFALLTAYMNFTPPKDDHPVIAYTDDLDSLPEVQIRHNVSPADSDDDEYLLVRKCENQAAGDTFYIGEDAR